MGRSARNSILIRIKSPTFTWVSSLIRDIFSPVSVFFFRNTCFFNFNGVSAGIILSRSSKYCQYRAPQAIPSPFLLISTSAIWGVISLSFHDVLKYPVPASIFTSSNFRFEIFSPPTSTSTVSVTDSQSLPCNNRAYIASVVALVVFHWLVCLFFSNHIFRLSTVLTSFFISQKASINRAWVSMGAWCQYQELVLAFQYIPNSSLTILFSSKDFIILLAVVVSPFL